MTRFGYNRQTRPPAPFALVTLRHPVTGHEVRDVPAQLDTGADRSLLATAFVQALGLEFAGSVSIGGVGGKVEEMISYTVVLTVQGLAPRGVEVLSHPEEPWVLLGRDILNGYRLFLDGPNLIFEID